MKKWLKIFQKALPLLFVVFSLSCRAQDIEVKASDIEKTFLPEAYVKSILATHQLDPGQLFKEQPIEAFLTIKGANYTKTYRGKVNPAHTRKNPNGELELLDVNKLINLMYYPEDAFKTDKFYIKKLDEKSLSLDIVYDGKRKSTSFISSVDGYSFEEPAISYTKLLLNGSYSLEDNGSESMITFDLKGNISDNEYWSKYIVNRVHLYSEQPNVSFYRSITLVSNEGKKQLNLAFRYVEDTKSWEGFSYEVVKGNVIRIKGGKVIKLLRKEMK